MKSSAPEIASSGIPARAVTRVLVLGYGNELRRDDGAGPAVARMVAEYEMPWVLVKTCHQLLPEHAAEIAMIDLVIFVDTTMSDAEQISVMNIQPSRLPAFTGHQFDADTLLFLCNYMFSRVPEAWLILIPGVDFDIGDGVSPLAAHHMQSAVASIVDIVRTWIANKAMCQTE